MFMYDYKLHIINLKSQAVLQSSVVLLAMITCVRCEKGDCPLPSLEHVASDVINVDSSMSSDIIVGWSRTILVFLLQGPPLLEMRCSTVIIAWASPECCLPGISYIVLFMNGKTM